MRNNGNQDDRITAFVDACRAAGVRVTHQRTEIFRELTSACDHPTADAVYDRVRARIPAISRDTVYRTLAFLESSDLVRRVTPMPGAARFDGNGEPHHHFVCVVCGEIFDVDARGFDAIEPPAAVRRLGKVKSVHVQLKGVCNTCGRKR